MQAATANGTPTRRERRCYVCFNKDGSVHRRTFLLPSDPDVAPRCADHGKMLLDPNRPYRPGRV